MDKLTENGKRVMSSASGLGAILFLVAVLAVILGLATAAHSGIMTP